MTLTRDLESLALRSRQFDLAWEAAMRRDGTAFREAMDRFRQSPRERKVSNGLPGEE